MRQAVHIKASADGPQTGAHRRKSAQVSYMWGQVLQDQASTLHSHDVSPGTQTCLQVRVFSKYSY